MTLDQIVKMQSIIDKRSIRCDTEKFLNDILNLKMIGLGLAICT